MCHHHVGDVIVAIKDELSRKPVGIVTDRDIVVAIVAAQDDPDVVTMGDICSRPLITVSEKASVLEATQLMRQHGIRRLPVINAESALVGIVTADDLVQVLAEVLGGLSEAITKEQSREAKLRH
jgi:CBS domain-containing protein